jgi:Mn2+/Fe2+ NRAMP family transporter
MWAIEKLKRNAAADDVPSEATRAARLKAALWDMRIGYILSLCTGIMFVIMGAVHLAGRGTELKGVQFAEMLSIAYTSMLGPWMYHVFMLTAFFAMFSTSYTVIDGFSRSFSECCALLSTRMSDAARRRKTYLGFVLASGTLACAVFAAVGNPVLVVTGAALVSLAVAPLLYTLNLLCVRRDVQAARFRPATLTVWIAWTGIGVMLVALCMSVYVTLWV